MLIGFFSFPGCSFFNCLIYHLQGKPVVLKYVKFQNVRRYAYIHELQLLQESFVRWTLIFFTSIGPVWPFLLRTINMMGKLQMFKKLSCMEQRKFLNSYVLIPVALNRFCFFLLLPNFLFLGNVYFICLVFHVYFWNCLNIKLNGKREQFKL